MAISLEELNKVADEFLREEFQMELDIPIKINGRLTRSLGRFVIKYSRHTKQYSDMYIDLAKRMVMHKGNRDVAIDVLKHELVHYALFSKGEPYRDGNPHFESTLRRLGITSTNHYAQCNDTNLLIPANDKERNGNSNGLEKLQKIANSLMPPR